MPKMDRCPGSSRLCAPHQLRAADAWDSVQYWKTHAPTSQRYVWWLIGRSCWLLRSEEHTSELQSLMRISYAVFCLKKKKNKNQCHQSRDQITSIIKTTE